MAIKYLKMLTHVGAALKTILHCCYNQFNPLVLQKSQTKCCPISEITHSTVCFVFHLVDAEQNIPFTCQRSSVEVWATLKRLLID